MASFSGRTIFISGGSRGIGLAIAARAAHDGARVALALDIFVDGWPEGVPV